MLRTRAIAALSAASIMLSGCQSFFVSELRRPGGYPGHLLDKRHIDSSESKSVQLLRAAMILSMASRMATQTVRDGKDADGFADYLAAASDELNYTASSLYKAGNKQPCDIKLTGSNESCRSYYVNFEADVPLLEARIVRLTLAALPENRAREFLEDVTKGDVLGAAWSAIRAAGEAASGLRRSAAVYRSNLELAAVLNSCKDFSQNTDTVGEAAQCFNLPMDQLFTDNRVKITGVVNESAFHSVMLLAETACARLPLNTDSDLEGRVKIRNAACQKARWSPALRPISIPTAAPPVAPTQPTQPTTSSSGG
jgi:hypothetical protein